MCAPPCFVVCLHLVARKPVFRMETDRGEPIDEALPDAGRHGIIRKYPDSFLEK